MAVKLYLRADVEIAPGFPVEVSSTFDDEESALAQAVSDIQQGNREHKPVRIEDEEGNILATKADIEKAAE